MWARVCVTCERALGDGGGTVPEPSPLRPLRAEVTRFAVRLLLLVGLVVSGWLLGEPASRVVSGALIADLVTWLAFALLMAPFQGVGFSAQFAARAIALSLAAGMAGGGLAGDLIGLEAAVGFFIVLFGKALWFGWFWTTVVDGESRLDDPDSF